MIIEWQDAKNAPTESGNYLVTMEDGFVTTTHYIRKKKSWCLWKDSEDVIGWAKRPAPYDPSAEILSEWYPTKICLPEYSETGDMYLVTLENKDVQAALFRADWFVWFEEEIIAWIPMPEGYKKNKKRPLTDKGPFLYNRRLTLVTLVMGSQ